MDHHIIMTVDYQVITIYILTCEQVFKEVPSSLSEGHCSSECFLRLKDKERR